jgi:hypothetical protein
MAERQEGQTRQSQISGNHAYINLQEELLAIGDNANIYTHEQTVPSKTWTVIHNMGKRPRVIIIDNAGDVIWTYIHHDSVDQITIKFSEVMTGSVICQ